MKYRTVERTGIGIIVLTVAINLAIFGLIGWVAWHFISKFW